MYDSSGLLRIYLTGRGCLVLIGYQAIFGNFFRKKTIKKNVKLWSRRMTVPVCIRHQPSKSHTTLMPFTNLCLSSASNAKKVNFISLLFSSSSSFLENLNENSFRFHSMICPAEKVRFTLERIVKTSCCNFMNAALLIYHYHEF